MSDPVPVSAISTPGVTDVGPVGSNGTGGGKLLTAAEVRSFSSVYSTSQVDTLLAAKEATLVSGTNIKTINSTSLLGSGDITVSASPAGSSGQVQYNNAGAFGGMTAVVYATSGTHLAITAQGTTIIPLCLKAAASQTANLAEFQTSAGVVNSRITATGRFSSTLNLTETEAFGIGTVAHAYCTLFGFGATSTGSGVAVAFGGSSSAGSQSIAFGFSTAATGLYACSIGNYSSASHNSGIAIGRGATTRKANQAVVGSGANTTDTGAVSEFIIGGGSSSTPYTTMYTACAGSGTNIGGARLNIAAGVGTGNATPAILCLQSTTAGASGATAQTLRDCLHVDGNTTSGETPLLLLDLAAGTMKRVSIGAADSGGTGYKVLRVPN